MCKVWAPRDSVKTGLRESGQEEVKGRAVAEAPRGVAQGSWCVMEGTP